jgi:pyruvate, water dikinase
MTLPPAGGRSDCGDGLSEPALYLSFMEDGYVRDPSGPRLKSLKNWVLTFNKLIAKTDFVKNIRGLLAKLEAAYGYPIDTEFTAFVDPEGQVKINLVQCRPMKTAGVDRAADVPEDIPPECILFRANRTISGGTVPDIRYILYIDPESYARKASLELKQEMGRIVGEINRHPEIVPPGSHDDGSRQMGQLQRDPGSKYLLRGYQ